MAVRFDVFFDDALGYYRVRLWGDGVDTIRKVPAEFWKELGYNLPKKQTKPFDRLALQWAAGLSNTIVEEMGRAPRTREMTLGELIEFYVRANPGDVKPKTLAKWKTLKLPLVAHFGSTIASQITEAKALEYRNARTTGENAVRNRTARNELDFLLQVIRWGYQNRVDTGMREINLLKRPKVAKQQPLDRPLTPREVAAISLIKLQRDGARVVRMVLFGVATGLRRTPLLNYRLEWANGEAKWHVVPAEMMKGRKGEERPLSVPLSEWAVDLLGEDDRKRVNGLAFPRRDGRANKQVDRSLYEIADRAGIRRFSLQTLRKTFLSILANAGVEENVREILVGHVPAGVSEEFYIQRHPDVLRAAIAKIDDYKREVWEIAREMRSEQTKRNGLRSVG